MRYIVHVWQPSSTAPATSKMEATIQACLRESTLAPTEVPKLLATSFAPIPNARMKETMNERMTRGRDVSWGTTSGGSVESIFPGKDINKGG